MSYLQTQRQQLLAMCNDLSCGVKKPEDVVDALIVKLKQSFGNGLKAQSKKKTTPKR
jgi:hypothetical protein